MLSRLVKELEFPDLEARDHFHCTLIFATSFEKIPILKHGQASISASVEDVTKFGNAVVLLLKIDQQHSFRIRNAELRQEMNAIEQYLDCYNPHVTIGYLKRDLTGDELTMLKSKFVNLLLLFDVKKGKVM